MLEEAEKRVGSRELAIELFDSWVRRRQARPGFIIPENKKELDTLGLKNFSTQLAEPRRQHLEQLKRLGKELSTGDKVALLVSMELPAIEISTLLHKLSVQLVNDHDAPYFNKVNQNDNCGVGCGCGCKAMEDLDYLQRINKHMDVKPFSIDPFNELGISEKDRDGLLIRDFLASYKALSSRVAKQVNERYFVMGESF